MKNHRMSKYVRMLCWAIWYLIDRQMLSSVRRLDPLFLNFFTDKFDFKLDEVVLFVVICPLIRAARAVSTPFVYWITKFAPGISICETRNWKILAQDRNIQIVMVRPHKRTPVQCPTPADSTRPRPAAIRRAQSCHTYIRWIQPRSCSHLSPITLWKFRLLHGGHIIRFKFLWCQWAVPDSGRLDATSPGCDSSLTIVPHIYALDSTAIMPTSVPVRVANASDFDGTAT
jgi:hypothetical protein